MSDTQKLGPKRGVSIYSYHKELYTTMTLEDCFADMYDMGATGVEILADGMIEGYPYPSNEWLDKWFGMIAKYNLVPVEYGHWVESRLYRGRELTTEESLVTLIHDIKLASKMGFTVMRTKLGVIDDFLTPVKNWREIILGALPYAEKYGVVMCPEIHSPTLLKDKMIEEYVEFIDKTGTKNFGMNIDFGVFMTKPFHIPHFEAPPHRYSLPEDIIPLLPYVYCCHAKFYNMNENFEEDYIPYKEIVEILKKHNWNGYLLSEYEGPHKEVPGYSTTQVRRQHVMLKRLLGE